MNTDFSKFDITTLNATRSYLQDLSRVIGKAQQAFVSPQAHDWQRGLEVLDGTIVTKPLPNTNKRIMMDLNSGIVEAGTQQWILGKITAPNLLTQIGQWLTSQGVADKPEHPEYVASGAIYDKLQAQRMGQTLRWAKAIFEDTKQTITTGLTSPVLLYPHHFDLSLTWFPFDDNLQMGLGFSFGDEYIEEPYFYVTAWPEPKDFGAIELSTPGVWFNDGFHGAVLRHADLIDLPSPDLVVKAYCQSLLESAVPMLKPST